MADVEPEEALLVSYDDVTDPDYEAGADPEYDDAVVDVVAEHAEEKIILAAVATLAEAADFVFELGRVVLPLTHAQPHPVSRSYGGVI